MSEKRPHFTPHPLCGNDDKTRAIYLACLKSDWETLEEYLKDSPNPRWSASHLVRALANGLSKADPKMSKSLSEIANCLATRK